MLELHRVRCTALRQRAQRRRVAEHFRQRHFGANDLAAADHVFHALDDAATARQVAHHIAHVVFRRFDFDRHHRLQHHRVRTAHRFLERHRTGHAERVFVRVDVVVRTERQVHLHVDDREARQHARLQRILDALVDGRDVFARNHAALDLVEELVALALLVRLERDDRVTVLAATARLLDELAVDVLRRRADRFAVRDLRLADGRFHAEFTLHPVDQNFEVELAHARNDRLARFFVGLHAERRIFLRETVQRETHLLLVGLRLRLDGLRDHRLREHHALKHDRVCRIAQRVARGRFLQADRRGDVARANFLDFLTLVRVHLQNTAEALFLALGRVQQRVTRIHDARIHAEEDQLADERVGHDLERERRELLFVGSLALGRFAAFELALDRRNVDRRRQEIDHGVEHALHALVLERGAAQHRLDFARDRTVAQRLDDVGFRQIAFFQVLVHQVFAGFRSRFDHLFTPFLAGVGELGRNVDVVELRALRRFVPNDRLHLQQVDHALEVLFRADRHHDGHRVRLQAQLELIVDLEEVRAGTVHLVDERETRHLVLVRLTPHRFRLRLHAAHCAVHHARAVEHAHRTLHFDREVDVARGIDDVDAVFRVVVAHTLPERRGSSGRDRDATLLFLLHPVHRRCAVVNFTDLVVHAGVKQNALGRRRLAGVDVSANTDVAVALDRSLTSHFDPLLVGTMRPLSQRASTQTGEALEKAHPPGIFPLKPSLALRNGSARTHGWLPPSGELRRASSSRRRGLQPPRKVHLQGAEPSTSRYASSQPRATSASPMPYDATGALRPEPDSSHHQRDGSSLRPPASRCSARP
ncbi:hypothetical protein BURPS1710b_3780 [Burkholderia pseudomallei 1710b]|uniref:Uncharacterized protein n=1 Tax=Burkholderia pseudomallei (strain 1710b) TaxID=320372 RepID=Q3JMQ9_BURP1|nr:hypothetical protein BURPS1710b_3780 [Burkholderia pseudomallei 1710b]